jgi:LuxR family maltose regulon positive regulatory protein
MTFSQLVEKETASTPALIAAKLHRPAPPHHAVTRPALVARLNAGLAAGGRVTLISAPAGYGKTTLAAEWAAQLDRPVAWLSLDEADDDPLRFCAYLVAALGRVHPAIGAELLPALLAGQLPPQAALVGALLNNLDAAPAPFVCVLDDFHAIQDPDILGILTSLLTHGGAVLHLVLVTREDPALPLARLRARAQLTEVRAADLRFDAAEVAAFLRGSMGLALPEADLARLAARTEGWPAGLQLAGLSLRGRADPAAFIETLSGSHRFFLGYLTEEVLARQPAAVQQFLLQTSILERLCGELCDALTDDERPTTDGEPALSSVIRPSSAVLEHLDRANVFLVPLDDEGRWYRYHHLFAELLQHKLRRECAACLPELHRRASRWHEAQAMPVEAIGHALAAGEHERVVALLERHGWSLLNQGNARRLERWLAALPAEWRQRSPRINLDFGWMRLLRGQWAQVGPHLAQAEAALAHAGDAAGALRAECLALQANLLQAQGGDGEAMDAANQALRLANPANLRLSALAHLALGGAYRQAADYAQAERALQAAIHASRQSGDLVTEALAVAHLTLMAVPYGRLHSAAAVAEETIARLADAGAAPPPIVGAVHGALGLIYWEWNQAAPARRHLEHGIRLGTLTGHSASLIYSQCNLARLLQAEGALGEAAALLAESARLLAAGAPGWVRPELVVRQVGQALALGDLAGAEAYLRGSGVTPESPVSHLTDGIHLAWLRWMIAGRHPQALALAGRILRSAEAGGRNGTLIQALVLGAKAGGGAAWLGRARQLAAPEGYQRIFIDEAVAEKAPVSQDLIEPLTERELEALRLLAAGLTYAEIAERLVVSVNTVRFHVKEIYGKLGVNRQAQAVARARELGLL